MVVFELSVRHMLLKYAAPFAVIFAMTAIYNLLQIVSPTRWVR